MIKKLFLLMSIMFIIVACEKEPLPVKDIRLEAVVEQVTKESAQILVKTEVSSLKILSQGVCYSVSSNPSTSDLKVTGKGSLSLVNLVPSTKYYAKAYAVTEDKTFYSREVEFKTKDLTMSLAISEVDKRSAVINIELDEELSGVKESGIYYSKNNEVPTASDKKIQGTSNLKLELLDYETTYFVRAYSLIGDKTYYSETKSFSTTKLPTVKDYDGNTYRVIEMESTTGTQLWLLDNFKGTHFANGDPIPEVKDDISWTKQASPAYCHYENDPKNTETYGALYNWYVGSDPRGLIIGWRPPTDKEWLQLVDCIDGHGSPVGHMFKEAGTAHWKAPNAGATNETGFTVLPAGLRNYQTGNFYYLKELAYFVTYDNFGDSYWARKFSYNNNLFDEPGVDLLAGNSIRMRKVD